jgi:hypothetical protein
MKFAPPRRLAAVAGAIVAGFGLTASLAYLRMTVSRPAPYLADDVARWFQPGGLGAEPGGQPRKIPPQTFLTRALSGTDRSDGGVWANHNQLTPRFAFSHNLNQIFAPKIYDSHPEFFPLEAGRRLRPPEKSQWWNPDLGRTDVAAFAAGRAAAYFDKHPQMESFALGINDGLVYGESPETLALISPQRWFRERPDYSNLVFTFMNRVAANLGKTHPDKYVGALAYYWNENTPDFPIHPQVVPFLTADRSQGYDVAFAGQERALQVQWATRMAEGRARRAGDGRQRTEASAPGRIGIYDYLYGQGFLIPRIHPKLIAENLREARRLGFTDYFAEMNPNWGLDGPQPWLVAQLLQDPEQSERQLLAEFYRRYFREAAFPMRLFFQRCEEQWMRQSGQSYWLKHFRNESQAAIFPSAVCRELRAILREARQQAKADVVRRRVQQVSDAFGVTERFVAMQEARDTLNRLALASEVRPVDSWAALTRFRAMRQGFIRYTLRLKAEQPLLIAPFFMEDYLRHDPTANALARLMEKPGSSLNPASYSPDISAGIMQSDADLHQLWKGLQAIRVSGVEVAVNGKMLGPVTPARRIAGLEYSVALPPGWQSRVEPSQFHQARIINGADGVLRVSGSKDTQVFQWVELQKYQFAQAQVQVRGQVSPSGVVSLILGWLDRQNRHLGMTVMRLPEGHWSDWTALTQAAAAPSGAFSVGIGMRIQHQQADDWIEIRGFSLKVK